MCRDPQPDIIHRERETKLKVSIETVTLDLRETPWKKARKYRSQRRERTPEGHGPLNLQSRAHISSQRLK